MRRALLPIFAALAIFACSASESSGGGSSATDGGGDAPVGAQPDATTRPDVSAPNDAGDAAKPDSAPTCTAPLSGAIEQIECAPEGACSVAGCETLTTYQCQDQAAKKGGKPKGVAGCIDTGDPLSGGPVCCPPSCVQQRVDCADGPGFYCPSGTPAPATGKSCQVKSDDGKTVTYCCLE